MMKHTINIGRRGPIEIIYNILYHTNDNGSQGISKTHIMYSCNLNWRQLEEYLDYLTERGLIRVEDDNGNMKYFLTRKGYEVLSQFDNLFKLLAVENKDID